MERVAQTPRKKVAPQVLSRSQEARARRSIGGVVLRRTQLRLDF